MSEWVCASGSRNREEPGGAYPTNTHQHTHTYTHTQAVKTSIYSTQEQVGLGVSKVTPPSVAAASGVILTGMLNAC